MSAAAGTPVEQIAAALRGFTFDGEKGLLVRTLSGERLERPVGDAQISLEPSRLSADGTLRDEELRSMALGLRERATIPVVVEMAGIGKFLIARSVAELDQLEQGGRWPALSPIPSRRVLPLSARHAVVADKVAVVTGAAQGFGAEIARVLAAAGAVVVIADLNAGGAQAFSAELNASAGRTVAFWHAVDVGDEESVRSLISAISRRVGGIDLFVSNAGVLKAGSVTTLALQDFDFVTRVNYTGFFLCTKHVAPLMAIQHRAAAVMVSLEDAPAEGDAGSASGSAAASYLSDIIQINSKSGLEGSNRNGAYAGAKFGGIGLVQSFAKELVADGIKVNAVCPGNFFDGPLWSDPDRGLFVQYLNAGKVPGAGSVEDVKRFYEQQVPMGRGCRGEDVGRAILYAVEQKYETGQAIPVTGGQVMLR